MNVDARIGPDLHAGSGGKRCSHRWLAKALTQKLVSATHTLPLYHLAQRTVGRVRGFHPRTRIEYAGKLAADVGLATLAGAQVIEIGTGWVPVVPMGLYCLGVSGVRSFDLSRHLIASVSLSAARLLPDCIEDLASRSGADPAPLRQRCTALAGGADWAQVAALMRFQYCAPADITRSDLPPGSADLIYSNLVLEHVPPPALRQIVAFSMRTLRAGGLCWHNIDYTDHYAHTAPALAQNNFLHYGEGFWRHIAQNDIMYLSRLRRSEYLAIFAQAGFRIEQIHDHFLPDEALLAAPQLSRRFSRCAAEDLRCASSRIVLRKA
jgi:Methyltransferase domain